MAARQLCILMSKKDNPLYVYATVSQLAFSIVIPLLVFLVGGNYAIKHFGWDERLMGLFVVLGIVFMLCGAINYIGQLIKLYGKEDDKSKYYRAYSNPRDNDYYDEYKDLHK